MHMNKKNLLLALLILLIALSAFVSLIRPGFFSVFDDMQVMRLDQMHKCILDLQIPCRWVPDLGYFYGYPLFLYYAPLPYYIMEVFHLGGLSLIDSVKIGYALSILVSGVFMFLFARRFFSVVSAFTATILYIYVPFRAADLYVRGAMGEIWGMAALPAVLFGFEYLISKRSRLSGIVFASTVFFYLTAHNLTVLITLPFVAIWMIIRIWNKRTQIKGMAIYGLLGVGLSAFYIMPFIFERNLVHVETLTQGYFNYINHFLSFKQIIFSTHWGFGPSELGASDDVFLGLGPLHFVATLLGGIAVFKSKQKSLWIAVFLFVFLSLFLSHPRSTFIWEAFSFMNILQFPWRYILLAAFCSSLLGGLFVESIKGVTKPIALGAVILIVAVMYGWFFRPKDWYQITDDEKLSGKNLQLATTASIYDYLPKTAEIAPDGPAPSTLYSPNTDITVLDSHKGTNQLSYMVATPMSDTNVIIPVYTFPNWVVLVDGNEVETRPFGKLGLVSFLMPFGQHRISATLEKTWPRNLGDWTTVISFITLVVLFVYEKTIQKSKH